MTEVVSSALASLEQGKVVGINKYCDIGALMLEDCQSFSDKKDKQILEETKKNICALYKELFDLKRDQRNALGDDGEILEYTKALFQVDLPEAKIVVPREKPLPKAKPMTKWEKFRKERGMPER